MIVRVQVGGTWLHFGMPQAAVQPEPFWPYLLSIEPIADATGDETASTAFTLALKAQELIGLNLRGACELLAEDGVTVAFRGIVARVFYSTDLRITVEA